MKKIFIAIALIAFVSTLAVPAISAASTGKALSAMQDKKDDKKCDKKCDKSCCKKGDAKEKKDETKKSETKPEGK
jgi:hypothetical protein